MKDVILIVLMFVALLFIGCEEEPEVVYYNWTTQKFTEQPEEYFIVFHSEDDIKFEDAIEFIAEDIEDGIQIAEPNDPVFVIDMDKVSTWAGDFTLEFDPTDYLISIVVPEPIDNVSIALDGIEIIFEIKDGKMDVVYDPNEVTESARVFFEVLGPYFSTRYSIGDN